MRHALHAPAGRTKALAAGLAAAVALGLGAVGCDVDSGQEADSTGIPATPAAPPAADVSSYRLESGGKALVDSAGTRIEVDPKLVIGYVDSAVPNGKFIDVSGWSAPADLSRSADFAVAIAGAKSVAAVAPSRERPDLVDGYDRPGLARAGFALSIPRSALDCSAPDQGVRTFGVAGDTAGPLEWLGDVPRRIADAC